MSQNKPFTYKYLDWKAIGKRVKALREQLELPHKKISRPLMSSEKSIIDLESGNYDKEYLTSPINWIYNLSLVLGVSLDYLILGKEEIDLDYSDAYAILKENGYDAGAYSGCLESKEIIWIAEGILREKEALLRKEKSLHNE